MSRLSVRCSNNISKAPEITRTRLYLETMSEVLPQTGQKIVIDESLGNCCRSSPSRPSPEKTGHDQKELSSYRGTSRGCFFLFLVFSGAFYTIDQTEQVIITQFGQPVGSPITEPGLHFKIPFVQKVNSLDKRFLEWDGAPVAIPTRDKTYIHVDAFARWRIADPKTYFVRLHDERSASVPPRRHPRQRNAELDRQT